MKFYIIQLSFILFILYSCEKKGEIHYVQERTELIKTINLDSFGVDRDAYYFQNEQTGQLFALNSSNSYVFKLNLNGSRFEQLIRLPFETISGITFNNHRKSFVLLSNDSIYEYSENGQLKSATNCGLILNGYPCVVNPTSFNLISVKNTVYIHHFYNSENTYKNPVFFKKPIEISFDLKGKTFKLLHSSYPKDYMHYCFGLQFSPDRITNDKNERIYTFAYNDSAFVYSGNSYKTVFFGSKLSYEKASLNFSKINSYNSSVFESFLNDVSSYNYPKYLQFSKKYIRKFNFKTKGQKSQKVKLVIYNDNFDYIGETFFKNFGGGLLFDTKELGVVQLFSDGHELKIYETTWK